MVRLVMKYRHHPVSFRKSPCSSIQEQGNLITKITLIRVNFRRCQTNLVAGPLPLTCSSSFLTLKLNNGYVLASFSV